MFQKIFHMLEKEINYTLKNQISYMKNQIIFKSQIRMFKIKNNKKQQIKKVLEEMKDIHQQQES